MNEVIVYMLRDAKTGHWYDNIGHWTPNQGDSRVWLHQQGAVSCRTEAIKRAKYMQTEIRPEIKKYKLVEA